MYENTPLSVFPSAIDDLQKMSDLEIGDEVLAAQYDEILSTGGAGAALDFLNANPGLLPKIHNAAKYNRMRDGLIAVQQYLQTVITDSVDEVYIGTFNGKPRYKRTFAGTINAAANTVDITVLSDGVLFPLRFEGYFDDGQGNNIALLSVMFRTNTLGQLQLCTSSTSDRNNAQYAVTVTYCREK